MLRVVILVVVLPSEGTVLQNVTVCVAYKGHRAKGVWKPESGGGVWVNLCLRPWRPKEEVIGTVGRVSR